MTLTYIDLQKILKQTPIGHGSEGTVFVKDNQVLKINNQFLWGNIENPTLITYINEDLINRYIELQKDIIYTELPKEIIRYIDSKGIIHNIGIIYPYYKGYKEFNELHNESKDLFLNNIFTLVRNNRELSIHRIFNQDIQNSNVLYLDNDIKLIDLDSKYISFKDNDLMFDYLRIMINGQIRNKLNNPSYNESYQYLIQMTELFDLNLLEKKLLKLERIIK